LNKKYDIKLPVSTYIQMISCILVTLFLLKLMLSHISSVLFVITLLCILLQVGAIFVLLTRILRKNNELEITKNKIKINHIEVPIEEIERIIIQGYFVQSIGIKQYGRRLVSIDLHFRFKNNEEINNIEELKQWANMSGIKVTSGKIYRWI
jgi:autotransporter translocation and assembly factor TamB